MKDETTARAIEQQLGIPGRYGAWWTARRLLQECWKHKPRVLRDTSFDLRDLPFVESSREIGWRRDIEPHMLGWHVHHFDKNSQYLAADRGMYTGIGDPYHVADGDDNCTIVPGLPGMYRVVDVSNNMGTFDGHMFPEIIEKDQEWVTNDVLLFAQKHGYTFAITEAWVFEDYARVLDKWAEKIWTARQALKGVSQEAYDAMKEIAIVGNGAWATGKDKHPGIDLIHPNWWGDTVGKARVALLANLLKYGSPLLIETDGLYYVSRNPDYRTAIPNILERQGQLGGYKYMGTCEITQEIYEQAQGVGFGKLAAIFKKAGNERG